MSQPGSPGSFFSALLEVRFHSVALWMAHLDGAPERTLLGTWVSFWEPGPRANVVGADLERAVVGLTGFGSSV